MSSSKESRNRLGITQSAFADLINCSAGQLSMYESGRRSLPGAAMLALALLENALAQADTQTEAIITRSKKDAIFAGRHSKRCRLMVEKMQQKTETLEEKIKRCQRLLSLGQAFEADPFLPDKGESHARMRILMRQTEKKLSEHGLEWVRLQLCLAGLVAEIRRAGELGNI